MRNTILLLLLINISCTTGKLMWWKVKGLSPYEASLELPSVQIKKSSSGNFSFPIDSTRLVKLPKIKIDAKEYDFEDGLDELETTAFLIIKNDTIIYEKYFDKTDVEYLHPSMSISKSFISALIGIAIDEGYINSVNDPITNYVNELKGKEGFDKITIQHLLDMRSGIKYIEKYRFLFSDVASDFATNNLKKNLHALKVEQIPDQEFQYRSINTQLLAYILENATGIEIQKYLEAKIWQPLGMESDATWAIDNWQDKNIKAFCCLSATARDYAKFGRLYLNNGKWNGVQVVPDEWVYNTAIFNKVKNKFLYNNHWWHNVGYLKYNGYDTLPELYQFYYKGIDSHGEEYQMYRTPKADYYAQGHLGQFIYIHPDRDIVIVRLGKKEGEIAWRLYFEAIALNN